MYSKKEKGFTLLETVIVVVIVSILVAIALPNYYGMKEREHDQDASGNLKLIMAAEKIYRMDYGAYYSAETEGGTAVQKIGNINTRLRLALPSGANRIWDYTTTADIPPNPETSCAQAARTSAGLIGPSRSLSFRHTGNDEPVSGNCP